MRAEKTASGKWRARAYNKYTKKQKSFTSESKKEAERLARQYQYEIRHAPEQEMTFGEAYDLYIAANKQSWSKSTLDDRKRWKTTRLKDLIPLPINSITDEYLQKWVDELAKEVSAKTVKNYFDPVRSTLKRYRKQRAIYIIMPKGKKPKLKLPSEATVRALLELVEDDPKFCVPVYLAAFGCMRRGEIAALDLSHINFFNNTIFIEWNKSEDGHGWYLKEPKNGTVRTISVPPVILSKIKKHGMPDIPNPNAFSTDFCRFVKEKGLPHLRFHDLRHYCAARMLSSLIPISVVQEYGGWKDKNVLLEIYDYVIAEIRDESMSKWQTYVEETCQKLAAKSESA